VTSLVNPNSILAAAAAPTPIVAAATALTSAELHQAVARYRVYISRWISHARGRDAQETVAVDLTWPAAQQLRDEVNVRLALEEPELVNCMARSIAGIQLTNREDVARILGYGPNFCHARAEAAVAHHLTLARNA
jgi:hypothetical protein